MSTIHGLDPDPHVLAELHMFAGCGSSQMYLLFALATVLPSIMTAVNSELEPSCFLMVKYLTEIVNRDFSIEGVSGTELFLLISTRPNDDVVELPGIHSKIPLWLTILVDGELARRIEDAVALILVLIVDPYFTRRQIEGLRLATPVGLSKSNLAVGDETDRPSCGGLDFTDVADVESQGARDRDSAHCFHFFKCVGQTIVLTFLKGLDQNFRSSGVEYS